MECKCGSETVVRFIQADKEKVEYQQCPKCYRQYVQAANQAQFDKVARMQEKNVQPVNHAI